MKVLSFNNMLFPNRRLRRPIKRKISSRERFLSLSLQIPVLKTNKNNNPHPKNEVCMRGIHILVDIEIFQKQVLDKTLKFHVFPTQCNDRFPKLFSVSNSWYFNLSWQRQKRNRNKVGGGNKEGVKEMLPSYITENGTPLPEMRLHAALDNCSKLSRFFNF